VEAAPKAGYLRGCADPRIKACCEPWHGASSLEGPNSSKKTIDAIATV